MKDKAFEIEFTQFTIGSSNQPGKKKKTLNIEPLSFFFCRHIFGFLF